MKVLGRQVSFRSPLVLARAGDGPLPTKGSTAKVTIYTLSHPVTGQVRYVGKTVEMLKNRLAGHLREKGTCHKNHWIAQLRAEGLTLKR